MGRDHNTGQPNVSDGQIGRLAEALRDQGVAPARDLWPGIDQAITAAEQEQIRPTRRRRLHWPQFAAAAAVVVLLLAAGRWGWQPQGDPADSPTAAIESPPGAAGASRDASGLAVIDQALDELNRAMHEDPDNRSLTSLALMLHQSRGRALRQNTELRLNGG